MKNQLTIVVATNNQHKLKELRELFSPYNVELLSLNEANIHVDPDENGNSYKENAFIKASEVAKYTKFPVMSDDSGIEISELGDHFPGIYSSRYAKENGGQEVINEFLSTNHHGSKATFYCHIVLLNLKPGSRYDFEGIMEGKINNKIEGEHGFGYDPIFFLPELNKTTSELSPEEKNRLSHRSLALRKWAEYVKAE